MRPSIELMRVVLSRLALIAFGLTLALVALEAALQLGSLFVADRSKGLSAEWRTNDLRILCLGDSNTYGVWLEDRESQAYPARLQAIWNESGRPRTEAMNLGYPGTNSSRVLSMLPRVLEVFRPEVVIVMVGVNDFWTAPVPLEEKAPEGRPWSFFERHSRVYRGFYMLARSFAAPAGVRVEPIATPEPGFERGRAVLRFGEHEFQMAFEAEKQERDRATADLRDNLQAIAGLVERSGARPLLMTYPSRWSMYALANRIIREGAQDSGTPLVDLEKAFRPLCPISECREWLYPDYHPTAKGYRRVAELIVEQLPSPDP